MLTLCIVPKVEFENEPLPSETTAPLPQSPTSPTTPTIPNIRPSRLVRFLNDLALRPNDPPHDLNEPSFRNRTSDQGLSTGVSNTSVASIQTAQTTRNPESDSFAYIETLLESLTVLGKLGSALDIVAQRLPGEIFNVVETTLEEAGERAEYGRRGSIFMAGDTTRSEGAYIFTTGDGHGVGTNSIGHAVAPTGGLLKASSLRLAALESTAKQVEHETLKDFFWTIYSKLDAISQGLRVVFEVSNRIGSVRTLKFFFNLVITHVTLMTATGFQRFVWSQTWHSVSAG